MNTKREIETPWTKRITLFCRTRFYHLFTRSFPQGQKLDTLPSDKLVHYLRSISILCQAKHLLHKQRVESRNLGDMVTDIQLYEWNDNMKYLLLRF